MRLTSVAVGLATAVSLAAQGTFTEWTIPTANTQPHCVVADSRGRIWYAGAGSHKVGVLDPATGVIREFTPPTPNSHPHGIAVDGGDTVWFTEIDGNRIGRIDPATFQITEYPLPNPGSGPHTPIWDGRDAIWFTEQRGNRIGRLNIRTGAIEEFAIPTPNSGPYGIVADAAGNAWFCSFGGGSNRIGRVDARTGEVKEFGTPTANSGPRRPWMDSSGRIWITENRANRIAVFDPATERFTEWMSPTPNGQPYGVVVDRDDAVWYNEFNTNFLVRFDPRTERFTRYPFPTPRVILRIVAVDPANRIWYGGNASNRIGVIDPRTSAVSAASFRATESNSGIAPGALVTIFGDGFAGETEVAGALPLPYSLGGVAVEAGGRAAPLHYVSPRQLSALIPFETAPGPAWLRVTRGSMIVSQMVEVLAAAPGVFAVNQQGTGAGLIVHGADFRLVAESAPAQPGEFIAILVTGLGRTEPSFASGALPPSPPPETIARPEVRIAGLPALVTFSGAAPFAPGVYQINVQVPASAPSGTQSVEVTVNGVMSNVVTMAVR